MHTYLTFVSLLIGMTCLQQTTHGDEPVFLSDDDGLLAHEPSDITGNAGSDAALDAQKVLIPQVGQADIADLCFEHQFSEDEVGISLPPAEYYRTPPMPHRLQFQAGTAALSFDDSTNVRLPTSIVGESLSSGDFSQRFDAGFAARLQYRLTPSSFAEASWLGDVSIDGYQSQPSPGGLIQLERRGGFSGFEALLGHEIETLYQMPFLPTQMSGMVGASGMWLDDEIRSFSATRVENNLWGLIGGLRAHTRHSQNTSTNAEFLGGIFNNDANLTSVGGAVAAQSLPDGSVQSRGTAFAGRISLEYHYALKQWVFLRAGYQVHFLSGIGLADTNFARNLNAPVAAADIDGEALLHGPSFGMVLIP